jgi:2-haloalkanoic acid dehalogenase type II
MASDATVRDVSACVFDVYGTLLDINSAIRRRHGALGPLADLVASTWRAKQLECAWTGSLAGAHVDFRACTAAALDYALALHGADSGCRDALLEAYQTLDPFDDAALTLQRLGERGIRTAVLSNGTSRMLDDALRSAGLIGLLEARISIDRGWHLQAGARCLQPRHHLSRSRCGINRVRVIERLGHCWCAEIRICPRLGQSARTAEPASVTPSWPFSGA